jgi:hypothetical protein
MTLPQKVPKFKEKKPVGYGLGVCLGPAAHELSPSLIIMRSLVAQASDLWAAPAGFGRRQNLFSRNQKIAAPGSPGCSYILRTFSGGWENPLQK